MKRSLVIALALLAPSLARADEVADPNQVMFGAQLVFVPQQNSLSNDVLAIAHYVSYSHRLDDFIVGMRAAIGYGWMPSGDPGQQWMLVGDGFVGAHLPFGKRFALRLEGGLGVFVNGGEGFSTAGIAHAYLRATAQLRIVKALTVEAFGGPAFLLGRSVAAAFPEVGLGVGWSF